MGLDFGGSPLGEMWLGSVAEPLVTIGIGLCPITCPRTVWCWYGLETKAEGAAAIEVAAIEAMEKCDELPEEAGDRERARGDVVGWP